MFSACTMSPNSKETKVGSSDQEVPSSAGKNAWIILENAAHGSYFWWCRYPNFSGCHLFSGSFTKITSRISVLVTLILSFCFYCTFNSVNWPYQKYINQLNFNHAFVQNLALPVFEVFFLILLTAGRSFNQTCLIFFLFIRETRTA